MNKIALTGLLSLSVLLTACGNSQKATKSNFAKAIDAYATHEKVCLPVGLTLQNDQHNNIVFLGNQEIRIAKRDVDGKAINKNAIKQMHVLVDAGLYHQEEEKQQDNKIPVIVFTRTEKSNDTVVNSPTTPLLCIGKQHVEQIILFTEPTPDNGVMASKVVYDARIQPEKWAEKLLKTRDDDWKDKLHQPQRGVSTLVLTNEGWKDIRAIQ
ncbi:hypothetical protein PT286_04165 [Neisseriaceae bacterium ESL0693]|nr:hypothetical protein [Neisseriaceae bacterium ESL0693]